MNEVYLYLILGIGLLVVIFLAIYLGRNFTTKVSSSGFEMGSTEGKGNISVKKVKNKSRVSADSSPNENNILIEEIDASMINVNQKKNKE